MDTCLIAVAALVGYLVAYHTYGRYLARKIFRLESDAVVPSHQLRDDVDYVPTQRQVIFGHHFTSIAGTGPIVGPAIAVFWGWLPALLWVLFGSIFVGAVHDFGALVVSLRNRGQTIGEVAGRLITPRARLLFLLVLFSALTVVLAIFGLVIAVIFATYPQSVLSVWVAMPIAVAVGLWTRNKGHSLLWPSLIALCLLYGAVYLGAYYEWAQLDLTQLPGVTATGFFNPVVVWTLLLLVYCFIASVLPVWVLLQPRDYVNSHQLIVALVLLTVGVIYAGITGQAQMDASAPMIATSLPAGAPPMLPFLFITIACGACSGFHCLVSSGTSSKQVNNEVDAQYIGYGAMLLEGGLAVLVILACCAGLGMGREVNGELLTGRAAWESMYVPDGSWGSFGLKSKVGAFIEGGANFLAAIGIPLQFGIATIAVLVASFAATTIDSATRLQRYVVQELGGALKLPALNNMYLATAIAVGLGGLVALLPAPGGNPGSGGLILWPLFGATNQLLAGLAFMVIAFYLWRRSKPVWFILPVMVVMLILPGWAMLYNMFVQWLPAALDGGDGAWNSWLLFTFGCGIMTLQIWMCIEAFIMWPKVKGVLEEALPPLGKGEEGSKVPELTGAGEMGF
ncbi:carbon starvation CstA family protein [Calycomorphotria hydatis]|uniref:Carbon starvation protein A n=1 Tax=Calycomorphotria hydatis TaxID=2528027 RepID=A0A517TES7_9PLAN|nr:carbon starvation protein A [Calycomorphotria hydatis]QDT66880.1 Carbon starvation protein A [Calycomorphotria hydatis]